MHLLLIVVAIALILLLLCSGHSQRSYYQSTRDVSPYNAKFWIGPDPSQAYVSFNNSLTPPEEIEVFVAICDLIIFDEKFPAGTQLPDVLKMRKFKVNTSKPQRICPTYFAVRNSDGKVLHEQRGGIATYAD